MALASRDDPAPPGDASALAGPSYGEGFSEARARKFAAWAKLLEHPPPDEVRGTLELRCTTTLGVHMVAKRRFESGELLISERPVLRLDVHSETFVRDFESVYGSQTGFLLPAVSVDWEHTSQEALQASLELFYAHALMQEGPMVDNHKAVVSRLMESQSRLKERFDVCSLIRFLHVVDLNIHKDEEQTHQPSRAGIFVFGSKFTHSCEPNSSWSFDEAGNLQYRACRTVDPGDILTFSYIGNGMNLLGTTLTRRSRLAALWFVCQCERCKGPDLVRQLICPRCGASRCLPCYEDAAAAARDWTGDAPLQNCVRDAQRWRCGACEATCSRSELPLDTERELNNLVPEMMQWGIEVLSEQSIDKNWRHCQRAARVLGKRHCTWAFFVFAWLQKWLMTVRTQPVLALPMTTLRKASAELAQFFAESCPRNAEQRLSALFLTARLASLLGGSLRDWGYDPEDPLADGGSGAQELSRHGWRCTVSSVDGPDEIPWKLLGRAGSSSGRRAPPLPPHMRMLYQGAWR